MFKLIIEKELRDIIGSTKFAVTFGVCSVLILLSFYAGARNYQVSVAQHEAAVRENIRQMEGLTDWFSVRQHRIFLPPQPLGALVTGISNDIGRTTEVQARGELTADDSRFNDDPVFALFRFLDLDFIFQIVLSLFAILFAYDAINGEKERGTLRLTFAAPVKRHTYILGKLAGSFLALAVPLLVPVLVGCLLLPLMGITMTGDAWARLALIILTGLLYFGVFLTLSLFVSAATQRSSSAFLFLLVAWMLAVLIVPRSAVLLAGRMVEVPTLDDIASQKNRLSAQLWKEDRERMATFTPTAGAPDKMMEEFNQFMQGLSDERDKKINELTGRLNEERTNRERAQQRLAFAIARLSPATAFSLAATALAGTSLELKQHYHDAAMAYQRAYASFMKEKTGTVPGGRMIVMRQVSDSGEKPKPIDPGELPAFTYMPLTLGAVFGRSVLDLGVLVLFNLLFFAGAFTGFLRYDVR